MDEMNRRDYLKMMAAGVAALNSAPAFGAAVNNVGDGLFAEKSQSAWSQYHKAIDDFLGGSKAPVVVQPLAVAQRAEWDNKNPQYNLFLKQDIGNAVPNWNPLYTRSGRNVPEEYMAFLDRLNSKLIQGAGVVDKEKLARLSNELRDVRTRLLKLNSGVESQWKYYLQTTAPSDRLTRARWEEEFAYSADRANLQRQIQAATGAYLVEVNNAGGELMEVGRAIATLDSQIQKMPLPSTPEEIELGTASWQTYYRTSLDRDIFAFLREKSPQKFTIKESMKKTNSFASSWNASATIGWCLFFSASGSVEHEDKSSQFEKETSEISFSFDNVQPFNIIRGQWYKPGLINRFLDKIEPSFWGRAGRLNIIPTQLILGHGLSVEIKTSAQMKDYIFSRHKVGASGGFSIGPFHLGGGGGSTTTSEKTTVTKTDTGLQVKDQSGRAVVLAVISNRPADQLKIPNDTKPLFMDLPPDKKQLGTELLDSLDKELQLDIQQKNL